MSCISERTVLYIHFIRLDFLECSIFLGYNNRFKRRLQKAHPNIWLFIDSIRKEVSIAHDLITQVNTGMQPRTKRSNSRIAEQRITELYNRFNNNQIIPQDLLRGLSFFVANEK